jgi:DNA-binding transcriptional LysR family regulator
MAENRVGLAVVPESAAVRYRASMELRTVHLEDSWAVRELRICIRSMETLPPAAGHLAEHLKAA